MALVPQLPQTGLQERGLSVKDFHKTTYKQQNLVRDMK